MGRGRTLTKYSTRVLAGVALVAGALAIPVHAGAEPTTQTFSYTGGVQEFVVPTGVCLVRIDAYGAQGGESGGEIRGGFGGRAAATITVTPGEVLKIRVGGKPTGTTGGFNGGGDGGIGTENESEAKGGGGASDVRQGGDGLANRVVVAGGGGGRSNGGGEGGGGGGENGVSGTGLAGGGGASQSAGGVPGGNGEPGTAGEGGDGGDGANIAGGGGGGGWFGGGGAGGAPEENADLSGGGGGGSGHGPAGVVLDTAVREGHGEVIIGYDAAVSTCPPAVDPRFTG